MKSLKWIAAVMSAAMLAGCGGGGGGDSAPSNELRIGTITPSTVNATFTTGEINRRITLSASYSGQLTGSVAVVVVDPDAVFEGAFVRTGIGSTVDLDLYVGAAAPVGRHTRPLVIHVCSDLACTREITGFPRTIQKDVTITGLSVSTTALSFSSTAGSLGAAQHVKVTAPAGVDYTVDLMRYADYRDPNGSTGAVPLGSLFQVQKDATGFSVLPLGAYQGRYTGYLVVAAPGYGSVPVRFDYDVGAASGPVVTLLTPSLAATGAVGAATDTSVYLDVTRNLQPINDSLVTIEHPPGAGANEQQWLRFAESTEFTPAGGATYSGLRLRFLANACFLGPGPFPCLAAGTYTATIVYRADAYGLSTTVRVPITFTINP